MEAISLYVHIPFCEQKCFYCAFNSFCANEKQKDEYIELLCQEIIRRKVNKPVKSIYFGGGTPSVLTCQQFKKIVDVIFENYNVYEDAEFTVEANPNSITEEKLLNWKKLRVNRLSVGVQSLSDKSLKKIGRLHDKKMALEKIKLARKYFDNVSADLLVGLEKENGKDLCSYAKQLLNFGIKHVSCYLLEVYENTKLSILIKNNDYQPLNEEEMIESFNKLANFLQDQNMKRYEISNFAFNGYESGHNLNYWQRGEYLGFGISAHSFEENRRYKNAETFEEYKQGKIEEEILTKKEIVEETIMLGLRCCLGVNLKELRSLDCDLSNNEYFKQYLKDGILWQKDDFIYLNPLFYHISNTIISNLL